MEPLQARPVSPILAGEAHVPLSERRPAFFEGDVLHSSSRYVGCAWVVLIALALPLIGQVLPCYGARPMGGCGGGLARCAGLWGASCCDFFAPRPRLQDGPDSPPSASGPQALLVIPRGDGDTDLLLASLLSAPERVPIGQTTGAGAGPILSSTVLRL